MSALRDKRLLLLGILSTHSLHGYELNELLKSDFVAIRIQDDDGGSPFHLKLRHQGSVGNLNLDRDKIIIHELDNLVVRVRNCTHLLATDSLGVEKIQQYRFVYHFRSFLCQGKFCVPFDNIHVLPLDSIFNVSGNLK